MTLFEVREAQDVMEDLLARERSAIVRGRFDVLERLIVEKERVLTRVARDLRPGPELERLKSMAERNQALLDSMQAGLRTAQEKIRELNAAQQDLHTYDACGQRQVLGAVRTGRSRRS